MSAWLGKNNKHIYGNRPIGPNDNWPRGYFHMYAADTLGKVITISQILTATTIKKTMLWNLKIVGSNVAEWSKALQLRENK